MCWVCLVCWVLGVFGRDCPLGCGFDWRILLLAIGALLLGLLTLLSLAMNIGAL